MEIKSRLCSENHLAVISSHSFVSNPRELQVHRQAVLSGHFVDHNHRLDPSTARLREMLHVSHEVLPKNTDLTCMFVWLAKRSKLIV